jgi:XTP/dITP diphosphohydrolase
MTRAFTEDRLIVASHNPGKVREIGDLLRPLKVDAVSAGELGLPEPDETEHSFIGNAILKAKAAAEAVNLPALADDSGLEVTALHGAPGIYSARWGGADKDFDLAMRKIEEALELLQQQTGEAPTRGARFVSALALAWPDGHVEVFEGTVEGDLCWPPRGNQGFGYDPIFVPAGHVQSFGEFDPEAKHAISHRANAFNQMLAAVFPGAATEPGA